MAGCVCIQAEQMEEGETAMSLLIESFETFVIINKTTVPDGYGGTTTAYTEGVEIMGAMPWDNSFQGRIAQALTSQATYTLTVRKNVELDFHTILKRKRDGLYFRTTSGTEDHQTPKSAALNMRQYSVEEFELGGT